MPAPARPPLSLPATTAELLLALFAEQGVRYVFFNPGTDTAPLQEAVLTLAKRGAPCPEILTCTHESAALAAAHGYFQATGDPQVVVVHVDLGTQNLGAMLHDAQRDHAGVVILAGKAPYTVDGSVPGGKSNDIHWQQDEPDQIGIVRNYVKWAQEIPRADVAARAVGRALQVARSSPTGPTYLMIAREVLMEPAVLSPTDLPQGYAPVSAPAADPDALAAAAAVLAGAERPVIVTSRLGRDPAAVPALTELMELLGAPVLGRQEAVNCSWRHPLLLRSTEAARAALGEADAVLVVDCVVPWIPSQAGPPAAATVVQIDHDPLHADIPLWSFPVDISITARSRLALKSLLAALRGAGEDDPALQQRWAARSATLSAGRGGPPAGPVADPSAPPSAADVMAALSGALSLEDAVLDESVTNKAAVVAHLDRDLPGTLFSAGAPGLGWSLGAAVGVKLADRSRRAVAVVGDGAFMFGQPLAAFMLADEARAPFLAVVLNNRGYRASRQPVFDLYPDGLSQAAGDAVATRFSASPDFAVLAAVCGGHGERVSSCAELAPAIDRALEAVDAGRCATIDVLLAGA